MIEYRRITADDVPGVAALACEALRVFDAPLPIDADKVTRTVGMFATTPGHFQMAAFEDGKPVAAIAAYLSEMPFFERCEAHVYICYATVAGTGARLIRAMLDWVRNDMRIRRVVWAMNAGADRMARMIARRHGFERLETLVFYKG